MSIDWSAVRSSYESGQTSLSALSRTYEVSRQAIKKRLLKEQWITPEKSEVTPQLQVTGTKQRVPNRDVTAAVKVVKAIEGRQSGWTYERIAQECGYADPSSARHAVQRELDRVIAQCVEDWRNDHVARLEKLHEEVWLLAMNKKNKGRLFAVDRLLAIQERQAKLLGLDMKPEDATGPQIIIEEVPAGYLDAPASSE